MTQKKIKIGVLLNSFDVAAWKFSLLKKIIDSKHSRIELILLPDDGETNHGQNWQGAIFDFYTKFDRKLFKVTPDAFELKDSQTILGDIPVIKLKSDLHQLKAFEPDVLLNLDNRNVTGELLKLPKLGVWAYHFGNYPKGDGLWEIFKNSPTTGSTLRILSENSNNGRILYRSYSRTHKTSPNRNRNINFWKSLSFVPRKLAELHQIGAEKFLARVENRPNQSVVSDKRYEKMNNLVALKLISKLFLRILKRTVFKKFYFDQWFLMFSLESGMSTSFENFKKIIPPKDRFWADPHIIHKDEKYYIFIEELLHKTYKGHLSLIVMDKNGNYEKPKKILEKEYHLSYPFVFEWQSKFYMIPETSANRTIDLYECVEFPDKWEFKMTLMEKVKAVDTTLFHDQNKWWLFVNIAENEGAETTDELFLFYADDFFTREWVPHPLNPIVSDVTRSRPAGRIFRKSGDIFRPSQDCSVEYGGSINLNQIKTLSENEYYEVQVSTSKPDWHKKVKGLHTLNHVENLTIIDAFVRRLKVF